VETVLEVLIYMYGLVLASNEWAKFVLASLSNG